MPTYHAVLAIYDSNVGGAWSREFSSDILRPRIRWFRRQPGFCRVAFIIREQGRFRRTLVCNELQRSDCSESAVIGRCEYWAVDDQFAEAGLASNDEGYTARIQAADGTIGFVAAIYLKKIPATKRPRPLLS